MFFLRMVLGTKDCSLLNFRKNKKIKKIYRLTLWVKSLKLEMINFEKSTRKLGKAPTYIKNRI